VLKTPQDSSATALEQKQPEIVPRTAPSLAEWVKSLPPVKGAYFRLEPETKH
jgi:hypothetical protein